MKENFPYIMLLSLVLFIALIPLQSRKKLKQEIQQNIIKKDTIRPQWKLTYTIEEKLTKADAG